MTAPTVRSPDETGNIMVLSIVLSAVCIALVLTLGTITSIHVERQRLRTLTEAAALHASTAIDEHHYYLSNGLEVVLTDDTVNIAVSDFLSSVPSHQFDQLNQVAVVPPTGTVDGQAARVTLSAYVKPGYIPWSVTSFDGFRITVSATAEAD